MNIAGISCRITVGLIISLLGFIGCSEIADDFRMPPAAEVEFHPKGFVDPSSVDFHGFYIRGTGWNFQQCEGCHGAFPTFTGGTTNISCAEAGCHVDFEGQAKLVTACNTCHGDFRAKANDFPSFAPPRDLAKNTSTEYVGVGAHQVHLRGNSMSDGVRCSECHTVYREVFEGDHLTPKGPEKVVFGTLASFETRLVDMTAHPPTYNPNTISPTCDNTYCHGNFTRGNNYSPRWTFVGMNEARCGTCHGDPETGNPLPIGHFGAPPHPVIVPNIYDCQLCHWAEEGRPIARRLEDGTYVIEEKSLHVDGAIHPFGTRRTDF